MDIESAARFCGRTTEAQTELTEQWTQRAQNAIGKTLNVRLDRKTTLEGTIHSVKYSHYDCTGRTTKIMWKVEMLCGRAQTVRTVHVSKLPM